jgi:uncharacterized protein (DUF4415 family)
MRSRAAGFSAGGLSGDVKQKRGDFPPNCIYNLLIPITLFLSERRKNMNNAPSGNTPLADRTDWARVRVLTDAEIRHDEDSPATCESDWEGAALKQGGVTIGHVRARGPNRRPKKEQVAVRYSPDVLAAFRAMGKGWQTRMNEALQEWLKAHPAG